jgi:hypothetical protein
VRTGEAGGLILMALTLAAFAPSGKAHAVCSVLSRHPCTPYVGSVLRHHPFTPYSCGVFSGPCSPEVVLMVGRVPVFRVEGHTDPPVPIDHDHLLDQLSEIGPLLSKCLVLPPHDAAQAGMELALRFAFKRNGALVADPLFTYTTRDAPENVKTAYHTAALEMLRRCTPLPVTDRFGSALAGRPVVVAIRETRDLKSGGRRDDAAAPVADAPHVDTVPGDLKP